MQFEENDPHVREEEGGEGEKDGRVEGALHADARANAGDGGGDRTEVGH